MFTRRRLAIAAYLFAASVAFLPGIADALTSYEGRDYSYDWGGAYGVGICDMESDNNPAYARYETNGNSRRLDDSNGSQPGCTDQPLNTRLYRHHACEGVFGNDPCGPWRYP